MRTVAGRGSQGNRAEIVAEAVKELAGVRRATVGVNHELAGAGEQVSRSISILSGHVKTTEGEWVPLWWTYEDRPNEVDVRVMYEGRPPSDPEEPPQRQGPRWDKDTWRGIFERLPPRRGSRRPPPEATTRDEISEAVRWYVAAPEIRGAPLPFAAADMCRGATDFATWVRATMKLGASEVRLVFPRGPETLLMRFLMRICVPHDPTTHAEPPAPIEGAQFGSVADRAELFAAIYGDRKGQKPNLALVELWMRLAATIKRRCGANVVLCRWRADHDAFHGRLYELLRSIQPLLPLEPGSIAGLGPKALGKRLLRAEEYARYMRKKLRKPQKTR
jgi:hypothetical protein